MTFHQYTSLFICSKCCSYEMWSFIYCISNLKICVKEIIYCMEEFDELNFTKVGVTIG